MPEFLVMKNGLKAKAISSVLIYLVTVFYVQYLSIVQMFDNGCSKEQLIYVEDLSTLIVKYILDNRGISDS